MEQDTNYLVVGIFVLATLVGAAAFILWLAGTSAPASPRTYAVIFERDVSGLSLGSPVKFFGVDVGEVTEIKLITDDVTRVAVRVSIDATTPVDQSTYATLAYQGITGVAFINLAIEPGWTPAAVQNDLSDHPIIPTRDVGIAALLAESSTITSQLSDVLDRASDMLSEDNRTSLEETLANVRDLSGAVAGERDNLAALPRQLLAASEDLHATLAEVRHMLDDAGPDLASTIAQLREASADIAAATERLNTFLVDNQQYLDDFVEGGLGELPGLVGESRSTLRELEKLLASLRSDPSQVIYKPRQDAVEVAQ